MDSSDLWEEVEVELMKKPGKGLGISVVGKKEAAGVFVSDMVRKSCFIVSTRRKVMSNLPQTFVLFP